MEQYNSVIQPNQNNQYLPVQRKKSPILVKIISIFYYILSAGCIISIIFLLFNFLFLYSGETQSYPRINPIFILIIIFILLLIFLILFFFVARGLWKGRNWSRITAIVISIIILVLFIIGIILLPRFIYKAQQDIGSLQNITSIFSVHFSFSNILFIIVNLLIIFYLGFNKKVKEFFR